MKGISNKLLYEIRKTVKEELNDKTDYINDLIDIRMDEVEIENIKNMIKNIRDKMSMIDYFDKRLRILESKVSLLSDEHCQLLLRKKKGGKKWKM